MLSLKRWIAVDKDDDRHVWIVAEKGKTLAAMCGKRARRRAVTGGMSATKLRRCPDCTAEIERRLATALTEGNQGEIGVLRGALAGI